MANQEQIEILKQGVEVWNKWREENPDVGINLREANLRETNLSRANLSRANLHEAKLANADLSHSNLSHADLSEALLAEANLSGADLGNANLNLAYLYKANLRGGNLRETNLSEAILSNADLTEVSLLKADLRRANLNETNLRGVDLRYANLGGAYLRKVNLSQADLRNANLSATVLIQTLVDGAIVSGSSIYGISVWDLKGEFEEQRDLIVTHKDDPVITVDNIKIAQFIYLILNNEEIRNVLDTLTSKSILILGRFALPERKAILDALRNQLRVYNLLPIVFDFDRPTDKDFTETIKTLAGLSYFVIADITNPKSSPLELQATIPDYQIPFVPIIQEGENPFAMMVDLQKKYNWVLKTVTYDSMDTLIKVLKPLIIDPAMKKRQELRIIKAQEPEVISGKDYLTNGKE